MNTVLLVLMFGLVDRTGVVEDRVDVLEKNSYFDPHGKLIFTQIIGWDYNVVSDKFGNESIERHVQWWFFPKASKHVRLHGKTLIFADGKQIRIVRYGTFLRSHTQHDPELDDRQLFPHNKRRGLTRALPNKIVE